MLRPAARSAAAEPREEGCEARDRGADRCEEPRDDDLEAADRCEEPRDDDLDAADRCDDDLGRFVWRCDEREAAGRAEEEREADEGRDEERAWPPRLDGRRDAARGFSSCPKAASTMNPPGSSSAIAAVRVAARLACIGRLLGIVSPITSVQMLCRRISHGRRSNRLSGNDFL